MNDLVGNSPKTARGVPFALYARWMYGWENRLCARATNRVIRPFEWGLEWTESWPGVCDMPRNGHDPLAYLKIINEIAVTRSNEFYGYTKPRDFSLEGNRLRFTSAVETPYR